VVVEPVVAESVPTAGESDQEIASLLPERLAVNDTAAPPAVAVALAGVTVSDGDGLLLLPPPHPAASARAARSPVTARGVARILASG
jgi:hypothetical protein